MRLYGVTLPNKTGFNLYYDAVDGMSHSAWQWVDPGAEKIFTYTFRLNDALFSRRDGYDLRINMGVSRENLRVVGVTVKKG